MSHHFLAGRPWPDDLRQSLLQSAQGLRLLPAELGEHRPLAGRHLAIACAEPTRHHADPVERAATGLGARVSCIPLEALSFTPEQPGMGRILGSLYDAIYCSTLSPERARELQRLAGIPVFDGLARAGHPLHELLSALAASHEGDAPDEDGDNLNSLLQAALIEALGS